MPEAGPRWGTLVPVMSRSPDRCSTLERGSPETEPRSCGTQPAHESLFNRRLRVLSPAVRTNDRRSPRRRSKNCAPPLESEHENSLARQPGERRRHDPGDARRRGRRRHRQPFEEKVEIGIDEDGDLMTSCIVLPVEVAALRTATGGRKKSNAQRTFREGFTEALIAGGQAVHVRGDGPKVKAAQVEIVRQQFYARWATGEVDAKKRGNAQRQAFRARPTRCSDGRLRDVGARTKSSGYPTQGQSR